MIVSYKYVKIGDEYMLVDEHLVIEYFEEFRVCRELLNESESELYEGIPIINYIYSDMSIGFKILYKQLLEKKAPIFNSDQDQILYLAILCKLANQDKITIILSNVEINPDIWLKMILVHAGGWILGWKDRADFMMERPGFLPGWLKGRMKSLCFELISRRGLI